MSKLSVAEFAKLLKEKEREKADKEKEKEKSKEKEKEEKSKEKEKDGAGAGAGTGGVGGESRSEGVAGGRSGGGKAEDRPWTAAEQTLLENAMRSVDKSLEDRWDKCYTTGGAKLI